MIKKNTYVQIYKVILPNEQRAQNLPNDTQRVPFEMRVKGTLLKSANIGDVVDIQTATNRIESGILIVSEPYFTHSFGHHVQVLVDVKEIIKQETEEL